MTSTQETSNNGGTPETWQETLERLSAQSDESWNSSFERATKAVVARWQSISQLPIDDDERNALLHASATLFQAKVAKMGYGPATREFAGPARASDELRRSGLVDAHGKDIENPT